MIARGRVLPAAEAQQGETVPVFTGKAETLRQRARILPRQVVEASAQAAAILERARSEAARLVAEAERQVSDLRLRAEAEARAEGVAKLAAHAVALTALEARADERALDRTVALARVLAERLLGESLRLAPEQVAALARQALAEARGARRVTIFAHPEDAQLLQADTAGIAAGREALRIVPDPTRARGSLRIETEIGVLDADLAPQLDRLARRLRETLVESN
jgi:flagellar biosynthesis/type III secretory pathway protein FliH